MCVSYPATLRLMESVSELHTIPIQKWINEGALFKFWGDNVDKKRHVRDLRTDHQGEMLHMFSLLVGRSRTPCPELPFTGQVSKLTEVPADYFLPQQSDIVAVKNNYGNSHWSDPYTVLSCTSTTLKSSSKTHPTPIFLPDESEI